MKKYLIPTITIASVPFSVLAAIGIPGVTAGATPPEFIGQIYNFALTISGVLALGAIVYGGIKYMTAAGNPSGQTEGKEWVRGAISGLVLLFGAYTILNFINPQITTLTLPSLANLPPPEVVGTTGPGSLGLTQQQALDQLTAAGIGIAGPIQLVGLRQGTVNELARLNSECKLANASCGVTVTSATGGAHEPGVCSHANGWKVDLRSQGSGSALTSFITSNYQHLPDRSDGAKMYRAPSGALYAQESDHWDVVAGC